MSLTTIQRETLEHAATVLLHLQLDVSRLETVAGPVGWDDEVAILRRAVGMATDATKKLTDLANAL